MFWLLVFVRRMVYILTSANFNIISDSYLYQTANFTDLRFTVRVTQMSISLKICLVLLLTSPNGHCANNANNVPCNRLRINGLPTCQQEPCCTSPEVSSFCSQWKSIRNQFQKFKLKRSGKKRLVHFQSPVYNVHFLEMTGNTSYTLKVIIFFRQFLSPRSRVSNLKSESFCL